VDGTSSGCEFDPAHPQHTGVLTSVKDSDGNTHVCSEIIPGCNECGINGLRVFCTKCTNPDHKFSRELFACLDACNSDDMYELPSGICSSCNFLESPKGYQHCKTCTYEDGCTSCLNGFKLIGGACVFRFTQPPQVNFHGMYLDSCPTGYFDSFGTCKRKHCLCTDDTNSYCNECTDFYAYRGDCVRTPPAGTTCTSSPPLTCTDTPIP
jgi:hypothetical protein